MYDTILVPLDGSSADGVILEHVGALASVLGSRVVLLHVATGPPARFHRDDAVGEEVAAGRTLLDAARSTLEARGVPTTAELRWGDPVREIVGWVREHGCDLVAMGTHGHRLLGDLILGATASRVQHDLEVPVLLLRAPA